MSLLYTPFSVTRLLPSLLLPLPGSLLYTHSLDGAARRQVSFSGGRLDSHEFARKWRERFPEEPLNASLAALGRRLTVASVLRDSPRFQVPHPRRVQLVREGGTSRVHLVRGGRGGGVLRDSPRFQAPHPARRRTGMAAGRGAARRGRPAFLRRLRAGGGSRRGAAGAAPGAIATGGARGRCAATAAPARALSPTCGGGGAGDERRGGERGEVCAPAQGGGACAARGARGRGRRVRVDRRGARLPRQDARQGCASPRAPTALSLASPAWVVSPPRPWSRRRFRTSQTRFVARPRPPTASRAIKRQNVLSRAGSAPHTWFPRVGRGRARRRDLHRPDRDVRQGVRRALPVAQHLDIARPQHRDIARPQHRDIARPLSSKAMRTGEEEGALAVAAPAPSPPASSSPPADRAPRAPRRPRRATRRRSSRPSSSSTR